MTDATPQCLIDALKARNRSRRTRSQWQILPSQQDEIGSIADHVNGAKHQKLINAFKPDGWIADY